MIERRDLRLRATDLKPAQAEEFLTQDKWFIDAENGDDRNSGRTETCALRTYAEWQRRVGTFTVLEPEGGSLVIRILGDSLPRRDPITFKNFLAAGTTARVVGTRRVVETGFFTAVVEKDRPANIPNQVSGPSPGAIGFAVVTTSGEADGARTYAFRQMPDDFDSLHVGTWIQSPLEPSEDVPNGVAADGFLTLAPYPVPGDTYEVRDYTHVTLGTLIVGYNPELALDEEKFGAPVGGLLLQELHVRTQQPEPGEVNADGDPEESASVTPSFPFPLGNPDTVGGFADCILDAEITLPAESGNAPAINVLFQDRIHALGGTIFQFAGGFRPINPDNYPGALSLEGGKYLHDGDVTFVGDIENGIAADIVNINGFTNGGPLSFWRTVHALVSFGAGYYAWENFSPLSGDNGFVPIWGDENVGQLFLFTKGEINIQQFQFDAPPALPSIVTGTGPGGAAVEMQGCAPDRAFTFDNATATFVPPGGNPTEWARLLVPIPAGFLACTDVFNDPDGAFTFTSTYSEMVKPGSDAGVRFEVGTIAFT